MALLCSYVCVMALLCSYGCYAVMVVLLFGGNTIDLLQGGDALHDFFQASTSEIVKTELLCQFSDLVGIAIIHDHA